MPEKTEPRRGGRKGVHFAIAIAIFGVAIWLLTRVDIEKLPGSFSNSDRTRNIYELIASRGFEYEQHFVTSKSGYILQLVRIVNPYVKDKTKLKPVFLHHGFQCTGTLWLVAANGTLGKDGHYYEYDQNYRRFDTSSTTGNTLGFVLAAQGYDVWLANYRGSIYSTNHTTIDTNDPEFWRFTGEEMVEEDLPVQIAHIQGVTGRKSLGYIGHSQGSFMMFGLLANKTEYSNVIKPFIALSPVAYLSKVQTPILNWAYPFRDLFRKFPKRYEFHVRPLLSSLAQNIYTRRLSFWIYHRSMGTYEENLDMNRLGVYAYNVGMGSSTWNFAQALQIMTDGIPRHFDHGKELNLAKYGMETPPIIDMSNINSEHIALFYTKNDWFNHMDSINMLKDALKVKLLDDYAVPDPSWNHLDLVWATSVGETVNRRILDILSRY